MNSETKYIEPCECGETRIITELNSYDVYEVIDGKLEFLRAEFIDGEKFYCSDCGEEFEKKQKENK